jgi:hypothetical protein
LSNAVANFKGYLSDVLSDSETKVAISEISKDALNFASYDSESIAKASPTISPSNLPTSGITSYGITIGLTFLGNYLATNKNKSLAARTIAKILGTDVDKINRNIVLEKLKDRNFFPGCKMQL